MRRPSKDQSLTRASELFPWPPFFRTSVAAAQPIPPQLFTENADNVDFGILRRQDYTSQTTNALGGNDWVVLPRDQDGLDKWGLTDGFHGGDGNDTIAAGSARVTIFGEAGNDIITGSTANDEIEGGDGDDVIDAGADLAVDEVSGGDGNDRLLNGRQGDRLEAEAGDDLFVITNHNSQWNFTMDGGTGNDRLTIAVHPHDLIYSVSFGPNWEMTTTVITYRGLPGSIVTRSVEGIEFAFGDDAFLLSNEISPFDRGGVTNYGGSLIAELMILSRFAYADPGTSAFTADRNAAEIRGWHLAAAMEFGMRSRDFGLGNEHYTFVDGVYSVDTSLISEGNATVLTGVVNDLRTIVIAFRGTDGLIVPDASVYVPPGGFDEYYSHFLPLIDAIKLYAADHQIEQILLTGHSLGAALAQTALATSFQGWNAYAYAYASPGSDSGTANQVPNDRIMTFDRDTDVIPVLGTFNGHAGDVIALNTVRYSHVPITGNHATDFYVQDMIDLNRAAANAANTGFYGSAVAMALRQGQIWTGGSLSISLGDSAANVLLSLDDAFVVGEGGGDNLYLLAPYANGARLVDGGAGSDRAIFSAVGIYQRTGSAESFTLTLNGLAVGRYVGIESLLTPLGLEFTNGHAVATQRPSAPLASEMLALAAGEPQVFTLSSGFDMADAGDGAMTVVGTANGDVIYAGRGDKAINGNGGDDIIFVRDGGTAAAGDRITLDGGAGADLMIGGAGNERLIVDEAGDVAAGGGGVDTVEAAISFTLPDDIENLVLIGSAADGVGNGFANSITGNGGSNRLIGDGDNDRLNGGGGADIIEGGLGADMLEGGSDADIFVFTRTGDSRALALRSDGGKIRPDIIGDFVSGLDKIDLSAIDANRDTGVDDAFTFIAGAAFSGHAGQLRCTGSGGIMRIMGDVDGDARADFSILATTPILSATDFIL